MSTVAVHGLQSISLRMGVFGHHSLGLWHSFSSVMMKSSCIGAQTDILSEDNFMALTTSVRMLENRIRWY